MIINREEQEGSSGMTVEDIFKYHAALEPKTAEEAREGLKKMAEALRDISPQNAALHDLLYLHSQTKHFFKVNKFLAVTSPPLKLSGDDMAKLEQQRPATRKKRGRSKRDQKPKEYTRSYTPDFIWGQLINWFKHSVANPATLLSNDKRGLIDLPSIDYCYSQVPLFCLI